MRTEIRMEERCLDRESVEPKRKRFNEGTVSADLSRASPDLRDNLITKNHDKSHRDNSSSDDLTAVDDDGRCLTSQVDEIERTTDDSGFKFGSELSLESIRKIQAQFVDERNWSKFHTPRNLLLAMIGEVGELSELFQWKNEVPVGVTDWSESERTHLSEELSDVLIYLIRLAEQCRVDLPSAVLRKIDLNRHKYPVDRVFGSSKKYNEYSEEINKAKVNGDSSNEPGGC